MSEYVRLKERAEDLADRGFQKQAQVVATLALAQAIKESSTPEPKTP